MENRLLKRIRWDHNKHLYGLALIKFLLHTVTGWQYGYFRDEFYYFAMSEHPDYGYLDVTPIVPHLMRLSRMLFGDSVQAIHIFPALAGAVTLVLACLVARRMGGSRFAEILTGVAILSAPLFLAQNALFTYDCFDQMMSAIFIYAVVNILKTDGEAKYWLLFGCAAGIGLMVKISFLFLGFSFVVALLLTKGRKYFMSKWLWIGGLILAVIFLPYIVWQFAHGGLILEYWGNYASGKTYQTAPLEYLLMQLINLNPFSLPLWVGGVFFLLFNDKGNQYRALGLMHIIYMTLAIMLSLKFYILSGTFYAVLAGGAILLDRLLQTGKKKGLKYAYTTTVAALGLLILPLAVPVLPIEQFVQLNSMAERFGSDTVKTENLEMGVLPQHFADRFGWEELVQTVAGVYNDLPPEQRETCTIFAQNYGEAGAIDLMGSQYGLPKTISGHLSYYVWGPGDYDGGQIILVGMWPDDDALIRNSFESAEIVARPFNQYAIPHENSRLVYLCDGLKIPVEEFWTAARNFG